jgi:hypothetical protein
LEQRRAELLPIPYFHIVFTVDHLFNPLVRVNQAAVYNLLFQAASETLREFGQRYLGGEIGVIAVLHTWGQTLSEHLHLHPGLPRAGCIVTGGALSADGQWQASQADFLFPVLPLSAAFRDRFCVGLQRLYAEGKLQCVGACASLADGEGFVRLVAESQAKDWEVYAKPPFGGAEVVLDYPSTGSGQALGHYVNRIAISNQRIVGIEGGQVRFTYRDYADGGRVKVMSLDALEFIRRFLLHVLPAGFVRIRYYGLWHPCQRDKLRRCRELLGLTPDLPEMTVRNFEALLVELSGVDLTLCPVCGVGRMRRVQEIQPLRPRLAHRRPRGVVPVRLAA